MSKKTKIIGISTTENFTSRMNKYIVNTAKPSKTLSVDLPTYYYTFYESIEYGKKSLVFERILTIFMDLLDEKNMTKTFKSRSDLVRNALNFIHLIFDNDEKVIIETIPDVKLPLGNIHHVKGEWRQFHTKREKEKYDSLFRYYNMQHL